MPSQITATAGITHHITIEDPDAVVTGYMLESEKDEQGNETGAPRIRIGRAPPLAPKLSQGHTRLTDQLPEVDLPWEINTFHRGGLSYRWTPDEDGRFNEAVDVSAATKAEFGLSNYTSFFDIIVRDGDFSEWTDANTPTRWTLTGTQTVAQNTTSWDGTYAAGLTSLAVIDGTNTTNCLSQDDRAQVAVSGATMHVLLLYRRPASATQSVDLTVGLTATAPAAAVACPTEVRSTTTVTSGTTTYTLLDATFTPTANYRYLVIGVTALNGETVTPYILIDHVVITYGDGKTRDFMEFQDDLYVAQGNAVLRLNTAIDVFEQSYVHTANAVCNGLGLSPTDDALVAGFGTGSNYVSNTTADATQANWTARTGPSGPYITIRDRIWAKSAANTIQSSVDVVTPTWATYNDIGTSTRAINALFAWNDVPVIGREDGVWVYNRVANGLSAADQFMNLMPEFQHQPHPDNFAKGIEWAGWLYLATRQGILRFNGDVYETVGNFFSGPQLADFGGRIKAFAVDGSRAYVVMDTPTSDTSSAKTGWILNFREEIESGVARFVVHPMRSIDGDVNAAYVHQYSTTYTLLYFGTLYSPTGSATQIPYIDFTTVPARHDSPYRDVNPLLSTSGTDYIITQYWDGLFPNTTKTFISLDFKTENMAAGRTLDVDFQLNDSTTWLDLGSQITTDGNQTLYFSTAALANRSGNRIRFRFVLASNSTTSGPRVIMPIVLHSTYRPTRLRTYEFDVRVASNLALLNGGTDIYDAAAMITALNGYVTENRWPLTLREDEDGDGTVTAHTVMVTDAQFIRSYVDVRSNQRVIVYRLSAIEKVVS